MSVCAQAFAAVLKRIERIYCKFFQFEELKETMECETKGGINFYTLADHKVVQQQCVCPQASAVVLALPALVYPIEV